MIRPISISLSPNTEPDDVWLAFRLLFQPWRWREEDNILEEQFSDYLGVRYSFSFNSGRSALMAILKALDLQNGDEVLLQAFTCNAVPNPVLWAGLKPVYVDCNEEDFNIDLEDLKRKISPQSKVVVVQHTFGLPADMENVVKICQEHKLALIEDCAHALGARYKGRKVGTFGRAAFFSFSRDKVISCVYGGMATTSDEALAEKLKAFQENVGYPSRYWIFQQLLHPLLMNWKILPSYALFGKYILVLAQWFHLLSKAVHWKEKRGMMPAYFPKRMPNALGVLALRQLAKLERFNEHRKAAARKYYEALRDAPFGLPKQFEGRENIFLRFTIRHPRAHAIIKKTWARNLLLGDWYTSPVAPEDTQLDKLRYEKGSCAVAERLAQTTLNLPTHIHVKEREVVAITRFLKSSKVYML